MGGDRIMSTELFPFQSGIVSLNIGQGGCQLGNASWELYCLEHKIPLDGVVDPFEDLPLTFFRQSKTDKVIPRTAFVDLEPSVIDEIRRGPFRSLFGPETLISGKEDAGNCFSRGYFSVGRELKEVVLFQINKMVEECDQFQGFLTFRSYGGGTGSGMGALLMETLSEEYPKCTQIEFAIYPAPKLSAVVVEPYNTVLAIHESLEHANASFLMDNEAAYDISDRFTNNCTPTFGNINKLFGHVIAAATSSLRFTSVVNSNLNKIQSNLVPYPRIQFPILSYAPLLTEKQITYETLSANALINFCFNPANQMVKCDLRKSKYMACVVLFRGDITTAMVDSTVHTTKTKRVANFVEWSPTTFKIGVNNNIPSVSVPGGNLISAPRSCVMLANSTAVKTAWAKVDRKFDLMFSKKAFIHWYISEGLELSDFYDARLDLAALEIDYKEVEFDC